MDPDTVRSTAWIILLSNVIGQKMNIRPIDAYVWFRQTPYGGPWESAYKWIDERVRAELPDIPTMLEQAGKCFVAVGMRAGVPQRLGCGVHRNRRADRLEGGRARRRRADQTDRRGPVADQLKHSWRGTVARPTPPCLLTLRDPRT